MRLSAGHFHPRLLGFFGAVILLMSVTIGLNTGYTAQSHADISQQFDSIDTHYTPAELQENRDSVNQPYYERIRSLSERLDVFPTPAFLEPVNRFVEVRTRQLVANLLSWSMAFTVTVGEGVAHFTYDHLQWIPAIIFNGLMHLAALGILSAAVYTQYGRLKEFRGGAA